MATSFIDSLPNVGRGVLDKDNQKCCLCQEEYGTQASTRGIIERPVKLPCNHIMGSECITLWLTGGGNSCPLCRHVFFCRPIPRAAELDENFVDWGNPNHEILDVADFDIHNRDQYVDLRSTTPSRDGHQDLTEDVVDHAWRRQRERAHYRTLQARNHDIPAPVDSPLIELEQELSDLVFRDLEEGGIFNELWGDNVEGSGDDVEGSAALVTTRREMWELMRDLGFSYRPSRGPIEAEWARIVWYPRIFRHRGSQW